MKLAAGCLLSENWSVSLGLASLLSLTGAHIMRRQGKGISNWIRWLGNMSARVFYKSIGWKVIHQCNPRPYIVERISTFLNIEYLLLHIPLVTLFLNQNKKLCTSLTPAWIVVFKYVCWSFPFCEWPRLMWRKNFSGGNASLENSASWININGEARILYGENWSFTPENFRRKLDNGLFKL